MIKEDMKSENKEKMSDIMIKMVLRWLAAEKKKFISTKMGTKS